MNCIIVDDDHVLQTTLAKFIKKTPLVHLAGSFSNGANASEYLLENDVDLIFLDVEMPEMTGIQFLRSLPVRPKVIMISGNRDYALDAFELDVIDFIHKPLADYPRFLKAIARVEESMAANSAPLPRSVFIKEDGTFVRIPIDKLDYVMAYGDYVKVFSEGKPHVVYNTLKSFWSNLPQSLFTQTHRSYVVNIDSIDRIEGGTLFIGDQDIPVSPTYRKALFKKMMVMEGPKRNVI